VVILPIESIKDRYLMLIRHTEEHLPSKGLRTFKDRSQKVESVPLQCMVSTAYFEHYQIYGSPAGLLISLSVTKSSEKLRGDFYFEISPPLPIDLPLSTTVIGHSFFSVPQKP